MFQSLGSTRLFLLVANINFQLDAYLKEQELADPLHIKIAQ